jgi:hypothetical protein
MPPVPPEDIEEALVGEDSPLLPSDKDKRLGSFAGRRHVFFSFLSLSDRSGVDTPVYDLPLWRFAHAFGFCLGGILFLLGTLLYYPTMYLVYIDAEVATDDMTWWIGWL